MTGEGCKETIALTENLVKVVNAMDRRLANRACELGYIESHQGICVNKTDVPQTVGSATEVRSGEEDPQVKHQVVMYQVPFSGAGRILSYSIYAVDVGDGVVQIWRPEDTTTYRLVCEDAFNAITTGEMTIAIPESQQCMVQADDVIGLYATGAGVVAYETVATADGVLLGMRNQRALVGNSYGLGGDNLAVVKRIYSVNALVQYF